MELIRVPMRIALTVCFCLALTAVVPAGGEKLSEYGNPMIPVKVKGVAITAEVVESPDKLYLGLSHRYKLPQGRGMLFIMPEEEIQQFCMRGMRFAIDIIWIGNGRVAGWEKNVAEDDPRILSSPVPVRYVLEVPAGFCDRYHVEARDEVSFRWP